MGDNEKILLGIVGFLAIVFITMCAISLVVKGKIILDTYSATLHFTTRHLASGMVGVTEAYITGLHPYSILNIVKEPLTMVDWGDIEANITAVCDGEEIQVGNDKFRTQVYAIQDRTVTLTNLPRDSICTINIDLICADCAPGIEARIYNVEIPK